MTMDVAIVLTDLTHLIVLQCLSDPGLVCRCRRGEGPNVEDGFGVVILHTACGWNDPAGGLGVLRNARFGR
jgi:hypothetical protein